MTTCPTCRGGWLCKPCQDRTAREWGRRQKEIGLAARHLARLDEERKSWHNGCDLNHNED